jgi:hypothetical protein
MAPYISFVVTARNDNYGGDFLHRMQVFLDAVLGLWEKHSLSAELIIVEWNPPEDRPRLQRALRWPKRMTPGLVRIIEVPGEVHHRLPKSDRMPMFEYVAKNVGIRRAKGEYVLATNPDLLYSEALIRFLALGRLSPACFYRIDRYDVAERAPASLPVERQLASCAKRWFRVNARGGTVARSEMSLPRLWRDCLLSQIRWRVRRYDGGERINHVHDVHANASGDFFLMARQHWHDLKGYPELVSYTFIDGYACFLAASSGLRQVVLRSPLRIYHQEHDRSEHAQRPRIEVQRFWEDGKRMLESERPLIVNQGDWGLGQDQLEEWEVRP